MVLDFFTGCMAHNVCIIGFSLFSPQPFLRRRRYKLYGAFFSATMIHPIDAPVEFEISIGNYGNKLDTNTPAQSSTTPPSNPLYDGKNYYYLPWFEQKPCIVVDSQWEDCSYRVTSMNILLNVADKLVRVYHCMHVCVHVDMGSKQKPTCTVYSTGIFLTSAHQMCPWDMLVFVELCVCV